MGDLILVVAAIYFAVVAIVWVGVVLILLMRRSRDRRRIGHDLEREKKRLRRELEEALRRRSL